MVETVFPASGVQVAARRPALGDRVAAAAAALFGLNGSVSKVVIHSGLAADRLTELRCAGALLGLAGVAALASRPELRVTRREIAFLAIFGIGGVALVQWTYFVAIGRLDVGVALVIQYVGPLLVALWARFAYGEDVRRRVWVSLALSLAGLVLVVQLWRGLTLDGVGLAAAVGSMVTFAFYLLLAERGVRRRSSVPLLAWGFLFATIFWSVVLPWWSFPATEVSSSTSLTGHLAGLHVPVAVLVAWIVTLGTIVPFGLIVGALHHLPATRVGIVAMLEPVMATVVAWIWLGERLDAVQLVGAAVVLAGIGIAQTAR